MDAQPTDRLGGLTRISGSGRRVGVALLLLTVALYLPGIQWGAPTATAADRTKTFATDEILPLEALAEMHSTFVYSKPDRNYGYPWWHYFVVAAAQAPYLVVLKASGSLAKPSPVYPFGLEDPVRALRILTLIGRLVSVLMAAGIVIAAYWFSRTIWDHRTGLVTALLTVLNYLMVYYGRTGNLDVPAQFWTSLGLVVLAKILMAGLTVRRAAGLGVLAGLAMATKDQAVLVFAPVAVALVIPGFAESGDDRSRGRAIAAGLLGSVVAYLVATGMLVDPHRHLTHVRALLFAPQELAPGLVYFPPAPRTASGLFSLVSGYLVGFGRMLTWPVFGLAVAGAFLVARSRPRLLVLLIPWLLLFFAIVLPTGNVVLRYLLPMTVIAEVLAAYAFVRLWDQAPRPVAGLVLLVCLAARITTYTDLVHAELEDNRYAAGRWLASHAKAGERLEYFGVTNVLPPLGAGITTRRITGQEHWVGETGHGPRVLSYLATQGPEWIASIPDWTSKPGMDHSAACPAEVCAALAAGTAGYTKVAYFPPCELFRGLLARPALDNPSVCPPVTIFARNDVRARLDREPGPD